jgi:4-hydroxybenzoate polyprenyltransferase
MGRILVALARELRPGQWVKNLACLGGLIFSGRMLQGQAEWRAALGFGSFCFASSSIYILNDYFDREKDRSNPRTASRPIASGELPLGVAAVAFLALLSAAATTSAVLGRGCLIAFLTYLGVNLLYSTRLKRVVVADVMCIAAGFVLRLIYGVYAVGVAPTAWIVLCMFFLALFLGLAKRRGEMCGLTDRSGDVRAVLKKYNVAYLDTLLTISATLTIFSYAVFTLTSHRNPTLVVTLAPVVYCVYRYLLQVVIHGGGESPNTILVSDWRLWAGIGCWIGSYILIDYGGIEILDERAL